MKINQVNFTYSPAEDRLLFRINTQSKAEFRMWLTRAMTLKLSTLLQQAANTTMLREKPGLAHSAMQAMYEFRRDAALARTEHLKPFISGAGILPFGQQAVLVTDITVDTSVPVSTLSFRLASGQEIKLSLDGDLEAGIVKRLTDATDGVDWGLGTTKRLPVAGADAASEKMMLH